MSENSLIIFSRANELLAQADTIQKTKELRNMAILAGEWAKRRKMGEEAVQYCRSYALRAERKMGEMLAETYEKGERQTRGGDRKSKSLDATLIKPNLSEYGLTKNESSRAQKLAAIDSEKFEDVIEGKKTRAATENEAARLDLFI